MSCLMARACATSPFTPITNPIEKNTTHHEHGERGGWFMPRHGHHHEEGDRFEARSGFGVRRPLRFLAHKLDLNEKQITELARILDELKTERAQAEVDDRRALAEFSDAVAGETFDSSKAGSAGERRVQSTAKVRDTLINALQQIHAALELRTAAAAGVPDPDRCSGGLSQEPEPSAASRTPGSDECRRLRTRVFPSPAASPAQRISSVPSRTRPTPTVAQVIQIQRSSQRVTR